ncbi:TetR/AcrR family transcriptional regulator [Streptomyces sp. NBC_01186]|uniref:TetR/AcrR family transcriptional regulator n=1 Tax=Streptomyces sp. NBC_01186 TaxID=2903765 RepID=UPI002E137092
MAPAYQWHIPWRSDGPSITPSNPAPWRPASPREGKKQRTRDALIDAALKLLQENGFAGTTLDELRATVGVSRPTFFRYFGSKEDVDVEAHFGRLGRDPEFVDGPASARAITPRSAACARGFAPSFGCRRLPWNTTGRSRAGCDR